MALVRCRTLLALAIALGLARAGAAAPGAFTDPAAFASAVPGGTTSVDFESFSDGTLLSGTTQTPAGAAAGVVLPGPLADVLDPGGPALPLRVVVDAVDNPASSGTRSLGVEDAGNFHAVTAGTPLAFAFTAPVEAFGLTVVTPEEPGGALFDADVRLLVPGEATAQLSLADAQLLGTFGGREYRAYFLGVVGGATFSSATLDVGATTPASGFFFNLDDLVVPLPEPGALPGLLAGALLLAALRRKG
ncbi:MAG: PEP-CTERM sorting domain-containing protein [Myxococcota bacterium]